MKRPAFQFYPADWRKDNELRSCSIGARGLWMELCAVMHECEPYGHLTTKTGVAMPDDQAARLCGVDAKEYRKLVRELEASGVPSRTDDGILYSRRMIRDEALRNVRAAGGEGGAEHGAKGAKHGMKGGRPRGDKKPPSLDLVEAPNEAATGVKEPPIKPPPSSASSSASINHALERTPNINARAIDSQGTGEKNHQINGKATENWNSAAWVTATAQRFGMPRLGGETDEGFADRVHTAANARRQEAESDAKRRGH